MPEMDIVERLRDATHLGDVALPDASMPTGDANCGLLRAAASEIERLRSALAAEQTKGPNIIRNAQVRSDLDRAASIIRSVWDNFIKTEPTFVLRDLIVVEMDRVRAAEREECAKVAAGKSHGDYRVWPYLNGDFDNVSAQVKMADAIAAAIRART